MKKRHAVGRSATGPLSRFSTVITEWVGSSGAFAIALSVVVVWALTGPLFRYSDTWQLVINTGTTVVTFLMVFLIQRSQNKESLAIQLKLNELVAAMEGASNRLVDVEDLTEEELRVLRRHYVTLASEALKDGDLTRSHSVDEATHRHAHKMRLVLQTPRHAQHSRTVRTLLKEGST